MSVTAVLITHGRPGNLAQIIDSLTRLPFVSEILVRDQSQGKAVNLMNLGRYVLAAKAINDIVYTQDDDVIIENLSDAYSAFTAMLLSAQRRLAPTPDRRILFGLAPSHIPQWASYDFGSAVMAIAGWGMFFRRDWLGPTRAAPEFDWKTASHDTVGWGSVFAPYIDRHGMDRVFYRETDRIFSLLLNRRHVFFHAQLDHLPGHDRGLSAAPDHETYRQLAIDRCMAIIKEEEEARE